MNRVFFHNKNDEQKGLTKFYYILLLFLLYGIFKNGILLYKNSLVSKSLMFLPFYLSVISLFISILFSLIYKERIIGYRLIINLLVSLIVMPNISMVIYVLVLSILNLIYSYYKFTIPAFFMVIVSIIGLISHNYSYLNAYESSRTLQYGIIDYLFGRGMGGISNTFLILTLILMIMLIFNRQYKKHIVLSFLIANFILNIVTIFITKDVSISTFINNNLLFAVTFVAPISLFSPYTRGGCYMYGIILAIICFAFSFFDINLGLYIGICLLSLIRDLLDRPFVR